MYYQNYEDYMRSVLGYPIDERNTYETYNEYAIVNEPMSFSNQYSNEIMDLYPDIYKIVNPMVRKICEANTKPITRELIEKMTEEIYLNLETQPEANTIVNVRVSTPKESNSTNQKPSNENLSKRNATTQEEKNSEKENKVENRQTRQNNSFLQDLIRILILNQLLGGGFPHRPPRPPRPPFPGPGPRPPMPPPRPRPPREDRYYNYNDYLKF